MFNIIPPTGVPFDWKFVFGNSENEGERFINLLSDYFGGQSYMASSGKSALYLILKALKKKYPNKNEIVIPNYTCWSLPSAIVRAGFKIRIIDIDNSTLTVCPDALSKCIDDKSCAVIVTHLFGIPGKIDEIEKICKERQLFLIDDAAQGLGATQNDKKIGSFGDAGILSFGRGKTITVQAGGAAIIRDKEIAEIADSIYNDEFTEASVSRCNDKLQLAIYKLFFNRYLYWIPDSLPFLNIGETIYDTRFEISKMADHRSEWGLKIFSRLEKIVKNRRKIAKKYVQYIREAKLGDFITTEFSNNSAYLRFPMVFKNRRSRRYILEKGHKLGISGMYPGTIDSINGISQYLVRDSLQCPRSQDIAGRLVTLPTHYGIKESDIKKIVDLIQSINK